MIKTKNIDKNLYKITHTTSPPKPQMKQPVKLTSRRKFILTAGATAVGGLLLKGCTSSNSGSQLTPIKAANVNGGSGVETTKARIGFIGQTDAAPLVVAKVKELFAKHGVADVELVKQPSWGVTRDNLQIGSAGGGLDGAMVLSPMPYQISTGAITVNNKKLPMYVLARLNTGGQGISLGQSYGDANVSLDASRFKERVERARASGNYVRFAQTFKGGNSDLLLRYWLAAGGIDPDRDIINLVVPGSQLVPNIKVQNIDGFCVGDPWHVRLINQKLGYTAAISNELWQDHPEKALGFRADWVDRHPNATKAIVKALMEAQQWCDRPENRLQMASIVAEPEWAKVPVKDIQDRLTGKIEYGNNRPVVEKSPNVMRYWDNYASYPFKSHDLWFLTENIRWGQLPANIDAKGLIAKVNREDIWRAAAQELKVADVPKGSSRGVETFFDGVKFDPENPSGYLKGLRVRRV
jgi:nitrate/nitrite transport system substrate-binding protein